MKYLNGVAVCCLGSILFLSCQEQFEEDSERQEGQQLPMSVIAQIGVIHTLNPQLHSRSATYKRNGLLIRKTAIKSSRPFQCAYYPLTP